MTRLSRTILVLGSVVLAVGTLAFPATAGSPRFTFHLDLGDPCLSGTGRTDARHRVSLFTPGGLLRDRVVVRSRGATYRACFILDMNANDRLRVRSGGQGRTFRIPDIQPFVDRVTDKVSGRAPAGTKVSLSLEDVVPVQRTAVARPDGRYQVDFTSARDISAGDAILAQWAHGGDAVNALQVTPFIIFKVFDDALDGSANRGADVSIELLAADGRHRGDAHAEPGKYGQFESTFRNEDGAPIYPSPGDRILAPEIASDLDLLVPSMPLHADAAADVVRAGCMPGARYFLLIESSGDVAELRGRADDDGHIERSVGRSIDIRPDTFVLLQCRYETGDAIQRWLRVP
jgi:hypothetical protein